MSENNNNIAMGWDDTIENDSEFVLLPEGDYDFEVLGFERKRFDGSAKMSACPMASVQIKLFDNNNPTLGSTVVSHSLFLNRKCEGLLCAFFTAIGDRKHGEALRMNWSTIAGKQGRCKVGIRVWKNNNGDDMQSNEIKKFYGPAESPKAGGFVPGKF